MRWPAPPWDVELGASVLEEGEGVRWSAPPLGFEGGGWVLAEECARVADATAEVGRTRGSDASSSVTLRRSRGLRNSKDR